MTRESLQTELSQQQKRLDQIRQSFRVDEGHPMFTKAEEIQRLINEINDDLRQFPGAGSYGSINKGIVEYIKTQIDQLKKRVVVRN